MLARNEENREWEITNDKIKYNYQILPGWHLFIRSKEISIHLNKGILKIFWATLLAISQILFPERIR